jgi:hypothetical protein
VGDRNFSSDYFLERREADVFRFFEVIYIDIFRIKRDEVQITLFLRALLEFSGGRRECR